jgi:hypothetical protein
MPAPWPDLLFVCVVMSNSFRALGRAHAGHPQLRSPRALLALRPRRHLGDPAWFAVATETRTAHLILTSWRFQGQKNGAGDAAARAWHACDHGLAVVVAQFFARRWSLDGWRAMKL